MNVIDEEELSVASASRFLWRHRLLLAITSLICATVVGVIAFRSLPVFRAEVVITDVKERGLGAAGSLASQLGGLASLAGVSLNPGAGSASQTAAAVLESHHLAEEFIRRNNLMPLLLRDSNKPPTLWLAAKAFKEGVVVISKDQRKGVTAVAMEWTDPTIAARWANQYVALANELIRTRALEESTRNIAYLNEQIAKSNVVEIRKVMYNLIENETKNLMVANGRTEYAFEVVDPAVPPELKVRPHRLLMTLIGFMFGFAAGLALAYLLDAIATVRRAHRAGTQLKNVSA